MMCTSFLLSIFTIFFFFLMIRRPPRSTPLYSSAASDVYKRQRLGPARLGVGVIGRAKRRDKDVRALLLASCRIKNRHGVAGPVDEQLLASKMRLAHRRRDALPPFAVPFAEPAVGVALGMLGAILLPEQSQRHAAPLQLRMNVRPVRLGACRARRRIRRRKQPPLQLGIIDLVQDRPAETRHGRTTHVLADRRLADPRRLAGKAPAHPQRVRQTQRVTYFPHRHSIRRHRSPLGCKGDRSADSTVDGSALYAAITCCPQSPDCCPPCAGNGVRVAPDSPSSMRNTQELTLCEGYI